MSPARAAALAIALAAVAVVAGCNAIGGIDEPRFDPCLEAPGGGCQGTTGSGNGGLGGGVGTTSSTGVPPQPVCGNGVIEAGEQCDDGNTQGGDGCASDCKVECTGIGRVVDPTTFHCYRIIAFQDDWSGAKASCAQFDEHLATITSQAELDFLAPHLHGQWWLGGDRTEHNPFVWDDGEAFSFESWKDPMGPPGDPKKNCLDLDGGKFSAEDCAKRIGYVCERDPPGT